MEYHRRGPHQGFWRLKSNWAIPSDAEMLKMVGPEQVVLTESMQVGQRHLQDLGYSQAVEDGDESNLSIEQQLAPWITTKNFLFATQAKAMLRLHGDGDPTGRGEAFSFIRISMKDIFVKAGEDYEQKLGTTLHHHCDCSLLTTTSCALAEAENRPKSAHRYNVAEQQQIYKSEIERIWNAQFNSLSQKNEPQLSDDEDKDSPKKLLPAAGPSARPSPVPSRAASVDPQRTGSVGLDDNRKVLRIKRLVSVLRNVVNIFSVLTILDIQIDGVWRTEIVRDPAVITAYVRSRQLLEEETTNADSLAPTGDADKDMRAKKR